MNKQLILFTVCEMNRNVLSHMCVPLWSQYINSSYQLQSYLNTNALIRANLSMFVVFAENIQIECRKNTEKKKQQHTQRAKQNMKIQIEFDCEH